MLLRWSLGLTTEADVVERAVAQTIDRGILTPDVAGTGHASGTTAVTDAVASAVASLAARPVSEVA